jgi:hypothetical protein
MNISDIFGIWADRFAVLDQLADMHGRKLGPIREVDTDATKPYVRCTMWTGVTKIRVGQKFRNFRFSYPS